MINSHIAFFAVDKKISKDFYDSIFLRFIITVWSLIICLKLKQYKKIKYTFSLIDYKTFLRRISFKRILFFSKVRYKILFIILWIFYFIDIVLIVIISIRLNNFEFYIKKVLLFHIYLWFIEAFFLTFFQKTKNKWIIFFLSKRIISPPPINNNW